MSAADEWAAIARFAPDAQPYVDMYADQPPAWLDELDLKPAPPHLRMGTHSLNLDEWFTVDAVRDAELQMRRDLIAERRDDVFAVLPHAEDACVETRDMIVEWLSARGMRPPTPATDADEHPLIQAGLLVQDDLCLMVHRDGDWHLDAAVLCFPSVWRLRDKLGLPTSLVHGPVHHYDDELSVKVDRFFDRLTVDKPVWRRNLSLKPTTALYLPVSKRDVTSKPITVGPHGSPYFLRTERQTLRRLPRSGAILFTIRTQLAPIGVLRHRPDRAADLLAMYRSWDTGMNEFKMADSDITNNLLPWLATIAY
jgi:dimethylamine monooxygenase subunit A